MSCSGEYFSGFRPVKRGCQHSRVLLVVIPDAIPVIVKDFMCRCSAARVTASRGDQLCVSHKNVPFYVSRTFGKRSATEARQQRR